MVQVQVQVLFLLGFSRHYPAAMPGQQALADGRSVHLVGTPLRLLVETRPAAPRFPAISTLLR